MQSIYYNKQTRHISVLHDSWHVTIESLDLKVLKRLQLNMNIVRDSRVTFFKTIESLGLIILGFKNDQGINYCKFDFGGNLRHHQLVSKDLKRVILEVNADNYVEPIANYLSYTYDAWGTFIKEDQIVLEVDLQDESLWPEKEWDYEYIECVKHYPKPGQFAYICTHANYGVAGIKIFEITDQNQLSLVYEMDELDFTEGLHNLTFNSSGEKYILFLYSSNGIFSIAEYAIAGDKKPVRIIEADLEFHYEGHPYAQYLTDDLLCIVRYKDIIVFDLQAGKVKEERKRNINSAYYVDFNILIYQNGNRLEVVEY